MSTSSSPWWFHVHGSGLAANTYYSLFMSEPNGTETGAEVYTDASGSFDSQALFGLWTGTYAFTVNKFSSGNVLQSCSTVVVGDHEK